MTGTYVSLEIQCYRYRHSILCAPFTCKTWTSFAYTIDIHIFHLVSFEHCKFRAPHVRRLLKKWVENVLIDCGCFNMIFECFHASFNSVIFFEFYCVVSLIPHISSYIRLCLMPMLVLVGKFKSKSKCFGSYGIRKSALHSEHFLKHTNTHTSLSRLNSK